MSRACCLTPGPRQGIYAQRTSNLISLRGKGSQEDLRCVCPGFSQGGRGRVTAAAMSLAELDAALDELAEGSENLPILAPEAYTREGIYRSG
jgi:hypothetical protein